MTVKENTLQYVTGIETPIDKDINADLLNILQAKENLKTGTWQLIIQIIAMMMSLSR